MEKPRKISKTTSDDMKIKADNILKPDNILTTSNDFDQFEKLLTEVDKFTSPKIWNYLHTKLKFKRGTFPGTHNVTFMKKHFDSLLESNYLAAEKSDGKRFLILTLKLKSGTKVYAIDRTITIYEVSGFNIKYQNSLFDCEIVKLKKEKDGKKQYRMFVFDCLINNNSNTTEKNLYERLGCASNFVTYIQKINKDNQINTKINQNIKDNQSIPFDIQLKQMFKCYGFYDLYVNRNNYEHENDGIVFTPVNGKYEIGVNYTWYKWKPADLNTVDFIIKKFRSKQNPHVKGVFELYICQKDGSKLVFFDYFFADSFYDNKVEEELLDNKVGEFQFDSKRETIDLKTFEDQIGGWKLYKVRPDKKFSNSVKITKNIVLSIDENIQFDDLEEKFELIKQKWKGRNN